MRDLKINMDLCMLCDICVGVCAKVHAISKVGDVYMLDNSKCEKCGACVKMCVAQAIQEVD